MLLDFMKKLTYYQCEYCKAKTRNLPKLIEHEKTCKTYTLTMHVAKSRIIALLNSYEKMGYKISIVYRTDEQCLITVYHPDYGRFK